LSNVFIEIPSYNSYDLFIEEGSSPNEWILSLIGRYDKAYIRPHREIVAKGFYLIRTEGTSIIFEDDKSNLIYSLNAYVDKVWHPDVSPSIKLKTIVTPIISQKIDENSKGRNLVIRWNMSGYGFLNEQQRYYKNSLIRIEATNTKPMILPRDKYVDILEKVDRYKREFIEIKIPSVESINSLPDEFQKITSLLRDRSMQLQNALKKFSQASSSQQYRDSIGDVRKALGAIEKQLRRIQDDLAEKLFLNMNTFTGPGSVKQSKATVDQFLSILNRLEGLASGLGIHFETKEKIPEHYISHPDHNDAYYLLLTSMLSLNYLIEKLRYFAIRR